MCARMWEPTAINEDCPHADAEPFGMDSHASFLRCRTCGKTLPLQASRMWPIRFAYNPVISLR